MLYMQARRIDKCPSEGLFQQDRPLLPTRPTFYLKALLSDVQGMCAQLCDHPCCQPTQKPLPSLLRLPGLTLHTGKQ